MVGSEKALSRRSKRGKTFTGCWTCRARKVKCDLRRPHCERCEKSGLVCGGYDIKLRWYKPVIFDIYGNQLQNNGNNVAKLAGDTAIDEPQYRRRNIDFVRYEEEYQYYEDMDAELTALLNPAADKIAENKTWIIKKFGVFRGIENMETVPDRPRRKKRKMDLEISMGKTAEPETPTVSVTEEEASGTAADLVSTDVFMMNFPGTSNHEWISNELRDDALLSAAALQGFPLTSFPMSSGNTTLDGIGTYDISSMGTNAVTNSATDVANAANGGAAEDAILQHALQVLFHRNSPVDRAAGNAQVLKEAEEMETQFQELSPLNRCNTTSLSENTIRLDCTQLGSKMPVTAMEVVPSVVPNSKMFNQPHCPDTLLNLPTTGLKVKGLTRFLLKYYYQNVADLMTVVALTTNPWKTQYFPRALKAIGDLAGLGYTSNSRNSLLNALLAVSCFNLKSKFNKNSHESQFFLTHGITFRTQASNFLRACLNETVSRERYKDVLIAILSMNSIDVVWGTMADCQHHLAICEDFVESRMKLRPKISQKAKALHRIFSFLKLIQDSTALDKVREKEIAIRDSLTENDKEDADGGDDEEDSELLDKNDGQYRESLNKSDGKIHIEFVKNSSLASTSAGTTPLFTNIASESYYTDEPRRLDTDILSTDALYGLPNSIILLFSDCVRLVRHNEYYTMNNMPLPRQFTNICLKYEKRLLKWTSEWDFHKSDSKTFIDDTIEGVYHHTMSFYNSLIIYYFTMARSLDYQFLQSYVAKVLYHLQSLSHSIQYKNVKIVPLIWQGFIAGCASIDKESQDEFKKWAATLAANGMGSYWGARQIMFEVWRRRTNEEQGDNWYAVYKDWEMNLMLS